MPDLPDYSEEPVEGEEPVNPEDRPIRLLKPTFNEPGVLNIPTAPLYSHLGKSIEGIGNKTMPAEQWQGTLKNAGVKPDELSQIEGFLQSNAGRKIPASEVAAQAKASIPQINEVWKTDAAYNLNPGNQGEARYPEYTLPGGENYRELLLTLPPKAREAPEVFAKRFYESVPGNDKWENLSDTDRAQWSRIAAEQQQMGKGSEDYTSPHWDEPNVLMHMRMNDRFLPKPVTDEEALAEARRFSRSIDEDWDKVPPDSQKRYIESGRQTLSDQTDRQRTGKTLFLEELQSDWHKQGRKKGYISEPPIKDLPKYFIGDNGEDERPRYTLWHPTPPTSINRTSHVIWGSGNTPQDVISKYNKRERYLPGEFPPLGYDLPIFKEPDVSNSLNLIHPKAGVPDAPFKKSWPELGLKRMVAEAARRGYDNLAWTSGDTQADRYDLSKQIDSLMFDPQGHVDDGNNFTGKLLAFKNGKRVIDENMRPVDIQDYVGKEVADKLLRAPRQKNMVQDQKDYQTARQYNKVPEGHPIGGDWHHLTGLDLKVGGEGMRGFYDVMLPRIASKLFGRYGSKVEQRQGPMSMIPVNRPEEYLKSPIIHVLPITPELRKQAIENGFPMYKRGGRVKKDEGGPVESEESPIDQEGHSLDAAIRRPKLTNRDIRVHDLPLAPAGKFKSIVGQRERPQHGDAALRIFGNTYTSDFHAGALDKFLTLNGYPKAKDGGIDQALKDYPSLDHLTSDNWGGIDRTGAYRPFSEQLDEPVSMPIDLHRAEGGRVDRSHDVPYLAGESNNGKCTYIDRRIPARLIVKRIDGGHGVMTPAKYLKIHEEKEHKDMTENGTAYEPAHRKALKAELSAVRADGFDTGHYQEIMSRFAEKKTEPEHVTNPPPDLYKGPYKDDPATLRKLNKS